MDAVVRCEITQREAYDMLVPAEARKILKAAEPFIGYTSTTVNYFIGCGVTMRAKKEVIGAPLYEKSIKNNSLSTSPAELLRGSDYSHLVPLLMVRDVALEIHRKWAVVTHTIDWLDKNHSAKVIRWLLPAIKTLKGAQYLPDDLIDADPPALGFMLPLIRETGVILSGAQFLPGAVSRQEPHAFTLHLDTVETFTHAGVKISTPITQYIV